MGIQEQCQIRMSLALFFVDEFTGGPARVPGLRVVIPGARPPIRKPEGYYVFTEIQGEKARGWVESPWYQRKAFEASLRKGKEPAAVERIHLYPNASCPDLRGVTCACGRALPRERLCACAFGGDYRRLLADGEKGARELNLYGGEDEELEGSSFCLIKGEEEEGELVELGPRLEGRGSTYKLKEPLRSDYKKMGTRLFKVYRTRADREGNYFLPLSKSRQGVYLFLRQGAEKEKKLLWIKKELKEGKRNRLDWEEGRDEPETV